MLTRTGRQKKSRNEAEAINKRRSRLKVHNDVGELCQDPKSLWLSRLAASGSFPQEKEAEILLHLSKQQTVY